MRRRRWGTSGDSSRVPAGEEDFYDVSLVDGHNVGIGIHPTGSGECRYAGCVADVNGGCPYELRVMGETGRWWRARARARRSMRRSSVAPANIRRRRLVGRRSIRRFSRGRVRRRIVTLKMMLPAPGLVSGRIISSRFVQPGHRLFYII